MTFADRTVLVTGASSGVGAALARELARRGARVVVHGRDADRLQAVASETGGVPVLADLGERGGPARLARLTTEAASAAGWPGVSVLVNNAAVQLTYLFGERAPSEAARDAAHEVAVDLVAPVQLTAYVLPQLRAAADASGAPSAVVNVTSGLALAPKKTAAVYCAAKAGLRAFSRALRYQLADEAAAGGALVRVADAVLPLVDTPMTAGRATRVAKIPPAQAAREILDGLAAGRDEIGVGAARLFRRLHRWAPGVAERMLRDG